MKKIIMILFFSILLLGFNNINAREIEIKTSKTIIVDDDGGEDYTNITEALQAANNGDTILVRPGQYNESLIINKSIYLTGTNNDNTIINTSSGIKITSKNVIIENFLIISNIWGIRVENNFTTIRKNKIISDWYGIWLVNSREDHIIWNTFEKTAVSAIWMYKSSKNEIVNNEIGINYHDEGITLGGDCTDNIIVHNIIKNVGTAVSLTDGASNNVLVTNTIKNNFCGFYFGAETKDNIAYHNNFINNTHPYLEIPTDAIDDGDNIWDNGAEGNYWECYDNESEDAWDNDSNGIIDTPYYIINESFDKSINKDNYPLASKYGYIHPSFRVNFKILSYNKLVGIIENNENEDFYNVEWTVTIKGGLFNKINVKEKGQINLLNKKEIININAGLNALRGFGYIEVFIEASTYGYSTGYYTNGFIIGRFLLVL